MTKSNPFRWDSVVMNLPGKNKYDPRKSWVYKLNKATGRIAKDFVIFVDDVRVVWGNHKEYTSAMYMIAKLVNYLGEHNASRKIREASQAISCKRCSIIYYKKTKNLIVCQINKG